MLQWHPMFIVEWMIPERQLKRKEIRGFIALLLLIVATHLTGCFGGNKDASETATPIATAAPVDTRSTTSDSSQVLLVPTWTNTPDSTSTQIHDSTPAPTPAPIITPTPTPASSPDEQLAAGKEALRMQMYSTARQVLTALVESPDTEQATRLQALFILARVEFDDPSSVAALEAIDRLLVEQNEVGAADLSDPSMNEIMAKGHFLRAEILLSIGRHSDAIAEYWLFLETYPQLGEVTQSRIADAYLAMGDLDAAAGAYRRAD